LRDGLSPFDPCDVSPPNDAAIHIGTCAWTFDDWRGVFYPEHLPAPERLRFYSRWFDAVEVDSTFYHVPTATVAAHWAEVTPAGFRFSCKVPREITHDRRLRDSAELVAAFLRGVEGLGEKLGCLLIQLPPWFQPKNDEHALREFVHALPAGFRWAIEFRDHTWHFPRIVHLLEQHRVAWVWNDLSPLPEADSAAFGFHPRTTDFALLRLMGDQATKYHADGGHVHHYRHVMWPRAQSLENWAVKIRQELPELRDVFIFTNNHFEGFSPHTAREIAARLGIALRLPGEAELQPAADRGQMRLWE
jgi:uncharacterized protein YecE (DUF72 family)